MIRLATHDEIPWLTSQMLQLKTRSAWTRVEGAYNDETLRQFLDARLRSPESVCYVWDDGDSGLAAFCGTSLDRFYLPPHVPILFEWGWSGNKREAVKCWKACRAWGIKRGAQYGLRITARPGSSARRVRELVTWEIF